MVILPPSPPPKKKKIHLDTVHLSLVSQMLTILVYTVSQSKKTQLSSYKKLFHVTRMFWGEGVPSCITELVQQSVP